MLTINLCLRNVQLLVQNITAQPPCLEHADDAVHICSGAPKSQYAQKRQHKSILTLSCTTSELKQQRHLACMIQNRRKLTDCSPSLAPYVSRPDATYMGTFAVKPAWRMDPTYAFHTACRPRNS
jgi:hypothetical protein